MPPPDAPRWRFHPAAWSDATALRDLERAASEAALGHVFPPDRYPYPARAVLERWHRTLSEPGVETMVAGDAGSLVALVAWDPLHVRHLAVDPALWGQGLATAALARTAAGRLWCLVDNHRALRLYRRLGWVETGMTRTAEWAPHPLEVELGLPELHVRRGAGRP